MDGIHDLGGRQGFGPIEVDDDGAPFHEPWEARLFGIVRAMTRPPDWSIDWFRHCRELIDPVDYLSRPYYDQWLQSYAAMLVNSGLATVQELADAKVRSPRPDLGAPMSPAEVETAMAAVVRFDRPTERAPLFAIGDAVRTRRWSTSGHTRLPAYLRGTAGTVTAHHGAHVLPDANAHGAAAAEPLYTVTFEAAAVWPEAEGRRDRIHADLWESYLEGA